MKRRRVLPSVRPKPPLIRVPTPPFGTHAAALDRAAVLLELARARHYIAVAAKRGRTKVGHVYAKVVGSPFVASEWTRQTRGALAAAALMKRATGPLLSQAVSRLIELERRGLITPSEAALALDTVALEAVTTSRPKVGHMPHIAIGASQNTDLPAELGSYSDGVSDDAAFHPEIIGCGSGCVSGLERLAVGSGMLQHAGVAGLGDLTVAGLPSYLFTRKHLSNPVVRRRLSAAINAMTPKLRRRVMARLKLAAGAARVSGAIRSVTPGIAGGWAAVSGQMQGISHMQVAGSRCPYASVAGAFTP